MMRSFIIVIFVLAFIPTYQLFAYASSGDRLIAFQKCLRNCTENRIHCPDVMPLPLRLTGWDCQHNCRYECMHQVITELQSSSKVENQHQFYGKWPFYRLLGMQEPVSVLFSLLNAWAQLIAWRRLARQVSKNYQPYKWMYQTTCGLHIHAWIWSAIFHTRDLPFTEKMDYFSAMSVLFFGTFVGIYRVFQLREKPRIIGAYLAMAFGLYYLGHIFYLGFIKFDYTYNIIVGVTLGIVHSSIWLVWCWVHRSLSHAKYCLIATLGLLMAMSLELLEFYPILGSIDAHSLWHLATVPLALLWNHFLVLDANHQSRSLKYM